MLQVLEYSLCRELGAAGWKVKLAPYNPKCEETSRITEVMAGINDPQNAERTLENMKGLKRTDFLIRNYLRYKAKQTGMRKSDELKVVATCMVVETRDVIGRCVALAIKKLREDRVFKHPGDYTYIMRGANEGVIKGMGFFYYPSEFLAYLREIVIDKLPGRNTLYDGITRTFGKFPEWTFSDHPSADEVI